MNFFDGLTEFGKIFDDNSNSAKVKAHEKTPLLSPPQPQSKDFGLFDLISKPQEFLGFLTLDQGGQEKPNLDIATTQQPLKPTTENQGAITELAKSAQGVVSNLFNPINSNVGDVNIFDKIKTEADKIVNDGAEFICKTADELKEGASKIGKLSELFDNNKASDQSSVPKTPLSTSLTTQHSSTANLSLSNSTPEDNSNLSETLSSQQSIVKVFLSKISSFFSGGNKSQSDLSASQNLDSANSVNSQDSAKSSLAESLASSASNYSIVNLANSALSGITNFFMTPVRWFGSLISNPQSADNNTYKQSQSKKTFSQKPTDKTPNSNRETQNTSSIFGSWITIKGWIGESKVKREFQIKKPDLGTKDDLSNSLSGFINRAGESISDFGKWSSKTACSTYEYLFDSSETTSSPSTYSSLSSGSSDLLNYASRGLSKAGSGLKSAGSSLKEGALGFGEYLGDKFQNLTNSSSSSSYSSSGYSQAYRIRENLSNVDLSGARRSASNYFSNLANTVSNIDVSSQARRARSFAGDIASSSYEVTRGFVNRQRTTSRPINFSQTASDGWASMVSGVRGIRGKLPDIGASFGFERY